MNKKNKFIKNFIRLCKIVIAIAPIIIIFSRINIKEFGIAINKVAWWTVSVVLINLLIAIFLQGIRWWILLKAFIVTLPFSRTFSAHLKGMFYSIIIPTAQDVFRAVLLSKENDYRIIWGASWVCKLIGLLLLALFSFYGMFIIDIRTMPIQVIRAIGFSIIIIIILFLLSFTKVFTRRIRPVLKKLLPMKIMKILEEIRESVYLYKYKKKSILVVFLLTSLMQFLVVLNSALILKGITGIFYLNECMFFMPIIEILALSFPITPNGIGIREALLPFFILTYLHRTNEELGIYIIIGLLGVLIRLTGGIPILYELIVDQKLKRNI